MKLRVAPIALFLAFIGCSALVAQMEGPPAGPVPPPVPEVPLVPIEWVPPALAQLSLQAASKSSFTFDRSMIAQMAGLYGDMDQDTRQAVKKLDGLSVHVLRFQDEGMEDPVLLSEVRDSYRLRGWKHVVSAGDGGAIHDGTTDVWVVMDGMNFRGAVVLLESARSLTLATVSGYLSPIDLLHLRGHFGIPRFDGDRMSGER